MLVDWGNPKLIEKEQRHEARMTFGNNALFDWSELVVMVVSHSHRCVCVFFCGIVRKESCLETGQSWKDWFFMCFPFLSSFDLCSCTVSVVLLLLAHDVTSLIKSCTYLACNATSRI